MKTVFVILVALLFAGSAFAADIDLSWEVVASAKGYKVYKSEDGGLTWDEGKDVGNVTIYKYVGVRDDALVLFRASAITEAVRMNSGAWYDGRAGASSGPGLGVR